MAELSEYSENKSCQTLFYLKKIFIWKYTPVHIFPPRPEPKCWQFQENTVSSRQISSRVSFRANFSRTQLATRGRGARFLSPTHITYAIKAPNNPRGFRVYRAPMARKITAQNHARSRRRKNSPAPWAKLWSCKTREKERAPGCKKHSVSVGFTESSAGAIFYQWNVNCSQATNKK